MNYWILFTFFVEFTLPRQSPIANRVLHKRQRKLIDVIDRHVMIFLMTYFRTTPMAMMWIMQPANPGLSCRILCCGRTADYFRLQLWTYENICVQYGFVLHCCDVMALCTASQISNKIKFCFVVFGLTLTLLVINTSLTVSCEQQTTPLTATSDECHQLVTVRSSAVCITLGDRTIDNTRWNQILVENCDFCLPPPAFDVPQGGSPSDYCHNVWYEKTRMVSLTFTNVKWKVVVLRARFTPFFLAPQKLQPYHVIEICCNLTLT